LRQLTLAWQGLRQRIAPITDSTVRERVLQRVPLHRQITEGCRAAGLAMD